MSLLLVALIARFSKPKSHNSSSPHPQPEYPSQTSYLHLLINPEPLAESRFVVIPTRGSGQLLDFSRYEIAAATTAARHLRSSDCLLLWCADAREKSGMWTPYATTNSSPAITDWKWYTCGSHHEPVIDGGFASQDSVIQPRTVQLKHQPSGLDANSTIFERRCTLLKLVNGASCFDIETG